MIRLILVAVALVGFLVFSIPVILAEKAMMKTHAERQQRHCLRIVQAMFRLILRLAGAKVTVKGRERIPEGAVLYVGNHRSYFDILVGYTSVPVSGNRRCGSSYERYA